MDLPGTHAAHENRQGRDPMGSPEDRLLSVLGFEAGRLGPLAFWATEADRLGETQELAVLLGTTEQSGWRQ